jgi:hypothetical protein
MKRKTIVGLIAIVATALIVMVFSGCVEEPIETTSLEEAKVDDRFHVK